MGIYLGGLREGKGWGHSSNLSSICERLKSEKNGDGTPI